MPISRLHFGECLGEGHTVTAARVSLGVGNRQTTDCIPSKPPSQELPMLGAHPQESSRNLCDITVNFPVLPSFRMGLEVTHSIHT